MLPLWPEYRPTRDIPQHGVLGAVSFGAAANGVPVSLRLPIRQLGAEPLAEVWRTSGAVRSGRHGDVAWSAADGVMFGVLTTTGSETDCITTRAYQSILECTESVGAPHLLRVWNHVGGINDDERELERYRRFSAGRHEAMTRRGLDRDLFPAASAVGMGEPGLSICFIASRAPAGQVENPRQVAAYDYPRCYGPRSPSFSRATVAQWDDHALVFVSGTSSVVGHETKHAGDVVAQLEETLRNLDTIIGEAAHRVGRRAGVADMTTAKTYLRRGSDYDVISARMRAELPRTQLIFVESDICRRDLLIEIESIVAL